MLLLTAAACAPEPASIELCLPSARFVSPEPDAVVLDSARQVRVDVSGTCVYGEELSVTFGRELQGGPWTVPLICKDDAEGDRFETRCIAEVPTDVVAACSGLPSWSVLHLSLNGKEVDEVGIPVVLSASS